VHVRSPDLVARRRIMMFCLAEERLQDWVS